MAPSETPLFALAHASDIHFGAIADARVVEALAADVNAAGMDVVCISGDLTQRARRREFAAARALLARFGAPTLVVPGNHDVYPWWNPVSRLFEPLRRYRREITADLAPSFTAAHGGSALAVLGINSAHGRTRKGGRISTAMRTAMQAFFPAQPPEAFRVLVLHHHLTRLRALGRHDVSRKAEKTLALAQALGVDLVLCGHLHVSHVEALEAGLTPAPAAAPDPSMPVPGTMETAGRGPQRLVIASAGTATSSRGRGPHRRANFYNRIRIFEGHFEIEERRFDPATGTFVTTEVRTFART